MENSSSNSITLPDSNQIAYKESPISPDSIDIKKLGNYTKRKTVTGFQLFEIMSREETSKFADYEDKNILQNRSFSMNNIDRILGEQKESKEYNFEEVLRENEKRINFLEYPNTPGPSESSMSENINNLLDLKLRDMKESMMSKLNVYKSQLEEKYENHIERIKNSVLQKAKRITRVIRGNNENSNSPIKDHEYLKKYTSKNIGEKLDEILEIHGRIEHAVEKNIQILINFLDRLDWFHANPIENFLHENVDDILDSWIISKMNFEKINTMNLIDNEKIPPILKNYLFEDTVNKFSIISINRAKNYDFEKRLLYNNYLILEKLKLNCVDHQECIKIFEQFSAVEGLQFQKLKTLHLTNSKVESENFYKLFIHTEKMILNKCFIKTDFKNISRSFTKLRELVITRSHVNNQKFYHLIEDLSNSQENLENLKKLNLSGNDISHPDFSFTTKKFMNLQVVNFSKNKIYKFKSVNLNYLPQLKILNLCSNNFTSAKDFLELKERSKKNESIIYFSFNKNLFIINEIPKNVIYIEYLIENLKNFDYQLKKLDLSFIFNKNNKESLNKIFLSSNIQISLKKLNLSFSNLDSELFKCFIKNNSGFINLHKINLSNNLFDDSFFEMYLNEEYFHVLENLEKINLSFNKITDAGLAHLEEIIKKQKKLKFLKLKFTPVETSFIEYLRSKKQQDGEVIRLRSDDFTKYSNRYAFEDFLESVFENKCELKIVFSKQMDNLLYTLTGSSSSSFFTKKNRAISKIIQIE
jgi:hypothetical protein